MINASLGEFQLDDHDLVIRPDLMLAEFKASDLFPIREPMENEAYVTFTFSGSIKGMPAKFWLYFMWEKFNGLHWEPLHGTRGRMWDDVSEEEQERFLDDWLLKQIGPPPYEYQWGVIASGRDMKSGGYSIYACPPPQMWRAP